MDSDERQICDYLRSWPRHFVAAREIARRADSKRRFRDEPQWAYPVLARLLEQGFIETDGLGHYRLRSVEQEERKRQRWISPQLQRILERSGKNFGEAYDLSDDYSEENEHHKTETPEPNDRSAG